MNEHGVKSVAIDLDGTLAEYDGWKGVEHIGKPIPVMMEVVKLMIGMGYDVEIFTARVSSNSDEEATEAEYYIHKWLRENGLPHLEVTAIKKKKFDEFWDDRAVHVTRNAGITTTEWRS